MLTKLKEKVQVMLVKEAKAAHRIGLTPNMVSAIGIIFACLSSLAYAAWQINIFYLLFATFLLLFSGFCDALDGALARVHYETTVFGGFLDSLLDRYADAVVLAGIIISGLCSILWGLTAMTGSLLVSYSRARAEAAGIRMESIGLVERAERIIILSMASIAATFFQPETAMNTGIILLAILSNLTVLQRGIYVYKKLKSQS